MVSTGFDSRRDNRRNSQKCKDEDWSTEKRFSQDLVQILRLMGKKIERKTDLVLTSENGETVTLKDFVMIDRQPNRRAKAELERRMAALNPFVSSVPGYPNWSAFTGFNWKSGQLVVQLQGEWYDLVKFHGVAVSEFEKACQENRWNYQRRMPQDIVQMVRLMGHKIDKTTTLELRDKNGKISTFENVEMTTANLRKLVESGTVLSRNDLLSDLNAFEKSLESQFAYLKTNNVDYRSAIQKIRETSGEENDASWLATELHKVIALFIDGHARVSGARREIAPGELPFLIVPSGDRLVAVFPDRSQFVHKDFPYVESIDGIKLDQWFKAAEQYVAKGSPQYLKRNCIRHLRSIQQFRIEMNLPTDKPLTVGVGQP